MGVQKVLVAREARWGYVGGSVELVGPGPGQTHVLSNGNVPTIAPKGLTVFGQERLPK